MNTVCTTRFPLRSRKGDTQYVIRSAICCISVLVNTLYPSGGLTVLTYLKRCESVTTVQKIGSETKKSVAKKKRKKYTRMPRLEPQDPRVSGAAEGGQGGSATATPTQQVTMFDANDGAAGFRICAL